MNFVAMDCTDDLIVTETVTRSLAPTDSKYLGLEGGKGAPDTVTHVSGTQNIAGIKQRAGDIYQGQALGQGGN